MTLPNITIAFAWLLLLASVRYSSGYLPPTLIRPVARILNKRQHFSQGPRTHRVRQKALIDDYSAFEDREREELSWLVLTTSKLIGNTALPVGTLEKSMIYETYKTMRAWARRSVKPSGMNAPYVVEQLLHRLIQEQHAGNPHVVIDTRTYNVVISSWSKSREEGAAMRAEEILVGMEKQYEAGNKYVKPNRASFNSVIKSWVRNESSQVAVEKAEALINYMATMSQRDPDFLPPCRRGYNLLLYAYAHSGLADAGGRAETILNEMLKGADDESIAPDINSFNLVIKSWGQGKSNAFEHKAQAVFDQVLQRPEVTPNHETFNAILSNWLKSKDNEALSLMIALLETMEKLFNEGNLDAKPDRIAVNSVMSALARNGELQRVVQLQNRMEEVYDIAPDTVSNNILVSAWSKSQRSEAPERALEILTQMEESFKKGNQEVKPDNYSYTSVIDCFVKANRPQAGPQAMGLLERMQALHRDHGGDAPSTGCYNVVLNSLATARNKDSAELALSILSEMEEKSKEADSTAPKPNRVTYNTCLKACRNGQDEYALRAEQLLSRLIDLGKTDASLAPDSYTYAAVVNVLGRSDNADKAERVLRVMNQMIASYKAGNLPSKPSTHVFNAALNACAFSRYDANSKMDAFVITVGILVLLRDYATADDVTYGTVLRACSNLLPKSDSRRDELVEKFFRKATREGQVSEMVLTQLKFAASTSLFREIVGIDRDLQVVTMEDLPRAWTSKVKRKARKELF